MNESLAKSAKKQHSRHSFYEILQTQEGFLALQNYFIKSIAILESNGISSLYQYKNLSTFSLDVDEFSFQKLLSAVLEGIDDFDALEIFDCLETVGVGTLSFREFAVLVFLFAAKEARQLLHCLYAHGMLLFDALSGEQSVISGGRARRVARLIGISEEEVNDVAEQLDLGTFDQIGFDEFQMFLYALFDDMDSTAEVDLYEELEVRPRPVEEHFLQEHIMVEPNEAFPKPRSQPLGSSGAVPNQDLEDSTLIKQKKEGSQCCSKGSCLIF